MYTSIRYHLEEHQDHALLYLGDIQESYQEPLYVDVVHYNAKFSEVIAKLINQKLVKGLE